MLKKIAEENEIKPVCEVFGECGGCSYQNISYPEELKTKQIYLENILNEIPGFDSTILQEIIPSPKPYNYRNRLDLKLVRTKDKRILVGFSPKNKYKVVIVDKCPIAIKEISDFIPKLKEEAAAKLTPKYRNANLTVRTGDDGRVFWGGIGRKSCQLEEDSYLWTKIEDLKIFYSLDTFFQANLSILPNVMQKLSNCNFINQETTFYDLYGGVGLFGLCLSSKAKKVILIEEALQSIKLAKFNVSYNKLNNFEIIQSRVEDVLPGLLDKSDTKNNVGFIDPPRGGLSKEALGFFSNLTKFQHLVYLSCNPQVLALDLKEFISKGWKINSIIPFDFFPKTIHLETMVIMEKIHE